MNPRHTILAPIAIAIAAVAAATPATAATATATPTPTATAVYRCGNTYSERPCAEGRMVEVDDDRTPGQRVEAARVAANERRSALALERERHLRERAPTPLAGRLDRSAGAAPAGPATPARPKASRRPRAGQADVRDFVAFDTSSRKKKRAD